MRLKKVAVICGIFLITFACFLIYMTTDYPIFASPKKTISQELQENSWLHFEDRLKQLEDDLSKHHEAVGEIKQVIRNILEPNSGTENTLVSSLPLVAPSNNRFSVSELIYNGSCNFQLKYTPATNIQMIDVYKKVKFDNTDGGVWKQGWKIETDPHQWNKQHKLKVFVIPHSHNDPGWIKTLEEYYVSQTKHILNNMVKKLSEDVRRKFIWAEISYFSMWWDELDQDTRDAVKKLIRNNQLEIVTGGWVMNDEANSHWISILLQLTEGHQWLQQNLNYTPRSHWSIDPFGLGLTQPYLLKNMGLENMLIQRVHYSIKKEFAKEKYLEFLWKQLWDGSHKTEMFTQMMPFYSYDIPHTCGPDPKVCCQFDFKRLPGHGLHCPWKIPPQVITDTNVAIKAELLLDQYRKKSQLFRSNVLLVPLGDDFRYDHHTEWDVQFNNYQKLFDHMNSNLNLHVQAKFGTLSDYFDAVRVEKEVPGDFPSLSGDFFTYADRDDHYWSGYYTSRPFYKRMDRVLMSYIRAAETILTIAHLSGKPGSKWIAEKGGSVHHALSDARKALALFQHHDGVTGTAKDHVVIDYGQNFTGAQALIPMLAALKSSQHVIQQCTNILLSGPGANIESSDFIQYNIDDVRHKHDSLPERFTIMIGPEVTSKRIVLFNSLTFTRHEVVTFILSTPFVEVLDVRGKKINCQVSPVFEYGSTMSTSKYKLAFIANVPALGLISYVITAVSEDELTEATKLSNVKIYNQYAEVRLPKGFQNVKVYATGSEFSIKNTRAVASFNKLGLLKAVKVGDHTVPVHLDFAKYGARYSTERSGGYLFLPDGAAVPVQIENTIVKVVEGPIFSSVIVQLPYVHHTVTLFDTPGADGLGLEIVNIVNIEKTINFELVMRFSTNINSADEYFTDANGYQMVRRKRFKKLPLQANYYPMPTAAYIEEKNLRLTILTSSSIGSSSLQEGHIEVMMDRRLNQDDNLGMGQGVTDNHPTKHTFRVLLELRTHNCIATASNHPAGFLTLSGHVASQTLLNPLIRLLRIEDEDVTSQSGYTPVVTEFGVDFSIASLRTGVTVNNKDQIGLVLYRDFLDVCFADRVLLRQFPLSRGTVNVSGILPSAGNLKLRKSSLSYSYLKDKLDIKSDVALCPMEMQALLLYQ